MMYYEELDWTDWTNYYVQLPKNCEIPINYSKDEILYLPVNYLILGRPGKVSVTRDLDSFMFDVGQVYTFYIESFYRESIKKHIIDFSYKEIIDWLINNYKDDFIKSRFKLIKGI